MEINLKNLRVLAVFGAYPEERLAPQELILNIRLQTRVDVGMVEDRLSRTLNYADLYDRLVSYTRKSEHLLLETLVDGLLDICLEFEPVREAQVEVGKSGVLPLAEQVSISASRHRL